MNDDVFGPVERDRTGELVSPSDLGEWGEEKVLDPAWEALEPLEGAKSDEDYRRALAVLVFHARHLSAADHARLAAHILREPRKGAPPKSARMEYIIDALEARHGRLLALPHEWGGLADDELKTAIQKRYCVEKDTASRLLRAAMREVERRRRPAAENGPPSSSGGN
jgi:hypothetical protein